jgi:hypothetical protein
MHRTASSYSSGSNTCESAEKGFDCTPKMFDACNDENTVQGLVYKAAGAAFPNAGGRNVDRSVHSLAVHPDKADVLEVGPPDQGRLQLQRGPQLHLQRRLLLLPPASGICILPLLLFLRKPPAARICLVRCMRAP